MSDSATTITDDLITMLEGQHGSVLPVRNKHGAAVFRAATSTELERFVADAAEPQGRASACRQLCVDCVLWPEIGEFSKLLARKPGLALSFANAITTFSGVEEVEVIRKSERNLRPSSA